MFCPNCGKENLPETRWCSNCGHELIALEQGLAAAEKKTKKKRKLTCLWIVLGILGTVLLAAAGTLVFHSMKYGVPLFGYDMASKSERPEPVGQMTAPAAESTAPEIPEELLPFLGIPEVSAAIPAPDLQEGIPIPAVPAFDVPEEPDVQGEIVEMSADQQFAANIFLSNFSEQHAFERNGFDHDDPDGTDLIWFAYLYCKINRRNDLGTAQVGDQYYYTLTLPRCNAVLGRHFGINLSETIALEIAPQTDDSTGFFLDDVFYYLAADGEPFNRLTVVNRMERLNDGSYRLTFDIYKLDLFVYLADNGVNRDYYALTAIQAAQHPALTSDGTGEAIVVPVVLEDGAQSWHLIRYTVWD